MRLRVEDDSSVAYSANAPIVLPAPPQFGARDMLLRVGRTLPKASFGPMEALIMRTGLLLCCLLIVTWCSASAQPQQDWRMAPCATSIWRATGGICRMGSNQALAFSPLTPVALGGQLLLSASPTGGTHLQLNVAECNVYAEQRPSRGSRLLRMLVPKRV